MWRINDRVKFNRGWKNRGESLYNHWVSGAPCNQIQFAFKKHYAEFRKLTRSRRGKVLEIGCGRGTMSSFFAEDGFDCYLLDYSSEAVRIARNIFRNNGHEGTFVCANAEQLPCADDFFDVVISFGLLEHFFDPEKAMLEQLRVAKSGGVVINYIVPKNPYCLQKDYNWINWALKFFARDKGSEKPGIYISDIFAEEYVEMFKPHAKNVGSFGVYPVPMISHSPEFPFSLMPKFAEKLLVKIFSGIIKLRRNGWLCDSRFGQAFIVYCEKK